MRRKRTARTEHTDVSGAATRSGRGRGGTCEKEGSMGLKVVSAHASIFILTRHSMSGLLGFCDGRADSELGDSHRFKI